MSPFELVAIAWMSFPVLLLCALALWVRQEDRREGGGPGPREPASRAAGRFPRRPGAEQACRHPVCRP